MKLFVKFLEDPTLLIDTWKEAITQQVNDIIRAYRAMNSVPFDPWEWSDTQPIFVVEQEDTKTQYLTSPSVSGRLVLNPPTFVLRFEWEQKEYDEFCKDYDMKTTPIPPMEREKEYHSLGTFDPYAEEVVIDFSNIKDLIYNKV